ncbi:MAG: hypothetical protein KDC35_16545 [Acidobacteria bacterium]|nr:hypothetical protein [Acidobacteriota bacterium]
MDHELQGNDRIQGRIIWLNGMPVWQGGRILKEADMAENDQNSDRVLEQPC